MTSAAANVNGDAEGAYKPFLLQTPQTVRPASGRKILTCVSKVSKVASNAPEGIPALELPVCFLHLDGGRAGLALVAPGMSAKFIEAPVVTTGHHCHDVVAAGH